MNSSVDVISPQNRAIKRGSVVTRHFSYEKNLNIQANSHGEIPFLP